AHTTIRLPAAALRRASPSTVLHGPASDRMEALAASDHASEPARSSAADPRRRGAASWASAGAWSSDHCNRKCLTRNRIDSDQNANILRRSESHGGGAPPEI